MYMYGVKSKLMKKFFAVIKYYCHVCAPLFAEILLGHIISLNGCDLNPFCENQSLIIHSKNHLFW